jgi:hypothetical protein
MLGSLGFIASRGMVAVPNLSGLTTVQAEAAIVSAGLSFGGSTSSSTGDSALHNRIATQSVTAGQLLDYDREVSFVYYNYISSPPVSYTYTYYCRTRTSSGLSGITTSSTDVSGNTCGSSITSCVYARTDLGGDPGDPGSIPACPGCTAGCDNYINAWSPCVNGSQYKPRDCVNADCSTYVDTSSNTQSCGCVSTTLTRFKDSCASSLEYYDSCTGNSQGCVPVSPPSGGGGGTPPSPPPGCTPSSSSYLSGCCTACTTTTNADCTTSTTCQRL